MKVVKRVATELRFFLKHLFSVSDALPQTVAQHLRWIMQKDLLGQDVFLIGPPGPLRRSIAMQYLVSTHETHTHSNHIYHVSSLFRMFHRYVSEFFVKFFSFLLNRSSLIGKLNMWLCPETLQKQT